MVVPDTVLPDAGEVMLVAGGVVSEGGGGGVVPLMAQVYPRTYGLVVLSVQGATAPAIAMPY